MIANRDVSDASQDLVKLRRIRLSLQCAPRSLDLHVAVGTAAQKAVSVVGQDALVEVSSSQRLGITAAFLAEHGDVFHACKTYMSLHVTIQSACCRACCIYMLHI